MLRESGYNQICNFDGEKILYNAITKACVKVTNKFTLQRILQNENEKGVSELKRLGIVVDESLNEVDMLQYLFQKNFFNGNDFLNIVLVPGLDCNFKCPYCFERVQGTESLFRTNLERYFSLLKKYAKSNFGKYKNIEVSLFGGEPLLFHREIFSFFEWLDNEMPNVNYFSSIVTNGALLDVEMAKRLLEKKCRSIQVTIDSCKEIHDQNRIYKNGVKTYDELINNINNCVEIIPDECDFNLRINLNNVSEDEIRYTLEDIVPEIRKKIKVLFRPIYNTERFQQINSNKIGILKPFLDLAISLGFNIVRNTYYFQACESCSGDNFFFLMPDLSVWKCINDLSLEDARIGLIDENGEIQFDAIKLLQWYKLSNCFLDEECKKCKMLPDCFGGCVLYRAKNGRHSCKEFDMASLPYLY